MMIIRYLCLVLIMCFASTVFASKPIFIGILESFNKKLWLQQTPVNSLNPRVRAVFYKSGDTWLALPSQFNTMEELAQSVKDYPDKVTWYGIHHGKNIGTLTSIQYAPHWYSDVGIQKIIGNISSTLLMPPESQLQFSLLKMNHRPLVLVSTLQDFDTHSRQWISSEPTEQEKRQIINRYNKLYKSTYRRKDILIKEYYRSKEQGSVFSILKKHTKKSDPQWFYFSSNGVFRSLGSGMSLIDTIDFDNNGQTGWIFLYNDLLNVDSNQSGYILFFNNFKQSARFVWSNH